MEEINSLNENEILDEVEIGNNSEKKRLKFYFNIYNKMYFKSLTENKQRHIYLYSIIFNKKLKNYFFQINQFDL